MTKPLNDPETYALMAKPFESKEKLDAAVEAFSAELRELRKKHKMTDVYVIIANSCAEGGEEDAGEYTHVLHCGSSARSLMLVASAFGMEKEKYDRMIATLTKRSRSAD